MRTEPRGAILALGLAVLATVVVMVVVLAGSAIMTNDKTRSLALADASAKSVATWYAQILNYDAYSNRAIAANEIMMAQAVTLTAWSQYVQQLSQNIGAVSALIPAVAPVSAWIQEAATLAHQMARTGAMIEVPLRSAYTRALQSSQQVMHASATPFAAQAMVNEVIWSGDSRFFGQIVPSSSVSAFYQFSKNYADDERAKLADLVRQGIDAYSRKRHHDSRLYLWPTTGCVPTSVDRAFSRLIRRGGTWLTSDYEGWESADTLSVHTWRRRSRWNPTCGGSGEALALGWGASDASTFAGDGMTEDPVSVSANPRAYRQARSNTVRIAGYLGLSAHRELSAAVLQSRPTASVRVPVMVRLPSAKQVSVAMSRPAASHTPSAALGNAIWSLSVAETFFHRPPDTLVDPATREFANLFSPFWASRLVAPDSADRTVATAMAQVGVSR